MRKRFYRSRDEKVVAGVCGGLAMYFNMDPTLVRLAVVLLVLAGAGFPILAYILAMIIVPKEPLGFSSTAGSDGEADSSAKSESTETTEKVDPVLARAAKTAEKERHRELKRERRDERYRNRSTFSKVLPGALLVGFGLLFMTKNFFWWHWGDLAPLALIFLGAYFILRQWETKKAENGTDASAGGDTSDGNGGPELSTNGGA